MDAARDRFAARGCSVLIVSQAKPEVLAQFVARNTRFVPIVCDPERTAYAAFGLERTRWLTFFEPRVLWGYFRGMLRGYRVKKPYAGEDVLQLGGDFILSRTRNVIFAHPSANPTDRPGTTDLLAALPSVPPIPHERPPDGPSVAAPANGT
ncbi:Alkyl hydroperoxide reductase/ Thiol specific antioxidant/ Mal allergen OS=Isosphaera pallida (strain ATCC 43644 / DSM 9630 / IS1B) GN=Isop_1548 PE=4 SV=1: AhpC-TSA_2 [Gemmata massiliana]|uniref:Alkyl hydroperoxide reductase subunit C/ Thiol specific antioxidant domain-containing protein n=1 Tax=Gemmata massiliana TaxID=1210884 RepID=A0A6P2CW26_9BACT|nr:Alkyl hydroperoxide reductase/ Thiol specific antioxidant/ Mal allergen OS=Isosphaera pallida (strain ATCC 43644 / DSM 9630 / IS1B) GN=Isop_1548 PE=4 SV=1: AhpC-TSA_2 [Gemmata massiliana]